MQSTPKELNMNNRRCNLRNCNELFINSEGVERATNSMVLTFKSFGLGKPIFMLPVGFTYGYSHSSPSGLCSIIYNS